MAKLNLLTVKEVAAAKPTDKITRLFDGGGLYLEIKPSGQSDWRYKFRLHGRERRMSLGPVAQYFWKVAIHKLRQS
ncbi:MAG: Arm DNA-binding domain-containing protein [Woeseiaceae bacterium]